MGNDTLPVLGWVSTVLALIGAVFNITRHWFGFVLWILSNGLWLAYSIITKQYALGLQFAIFLPLSIWGLVFWLKYPPNSSSREGT